MIAHDAEYTFGTWHVDSPIEWVLLVLSYVVPLLMLVGCVGVLFAIAAPHMLGEFSFRSVLKGCGFFAGCALISLLIAGAISL